MSKVRGFIQNIVIIAVILAVVFLSQLPYFKTNSQIYNFPLFKKSEGYSGNFSFNSNRVNDWLKSNVYDRIGGEAEKRQELATGEINKQKEEIAKNSVYRVKKFIAEKLLETLGVKPEELADQPECQPQK